MSRRETGADEMHGATGAAGRDRRSEILHQELERRLEFLEASEDSVFGAFTTLDWILCTLLFFALPLLVLGFMAL